MSFTAFAEAFYPLGGPAIHFDFLSLSTDGIKPRVTRRVGQHEPRWKRENLGVVSSGEPVVKTWRCEVCNLIFKGEKPPR